MRKTLAMALLLAVVAMPAHALTKGTSMFAIQLTNGTADLYDPSGVGGGYITAYDHSEIGVQAQFWSLMSDDYAFTVAGGLGFFGETDEPGTNAAPGDGDFKYTQSSFNVRVGGDRMVSIGDRAVVYFGPGIEFWSGKAKFETAGSPTVETENVSRISLNGRLGGTMMIGKNWGMTGHVGHRIGHASAEDQGAKATWWPSSFESAGGLVFTFGGN